MSENRAVWRQTAIISTIALAVFLVVRWLPLAGGTLHYKDFHAGEKSFMEFCDPGSPQFVPVDRVRSPVALVLSPGKALRAGEAVRVRGQLTTSAGKPITFDDLLVVHTEKLHLLLVDPSLEDYQHVHPVPTARAGEFEFEFTPRGSGDYRVFADFTPKPTGRGLYAGTTLSVASGQSANAAAPVPTIDRTVKLRVQSEDFDYTLASSEARVRPGALTTMTLTISRRDGGAVVLDEIMGAPAHLVAFDETRSGFAHLHPLPVKENAVAVGAGVDGRGPVQLAFSFSVPEPGYFRLWAQLRIADHERFVPFGFIVER